MVSAASTVTEFFMPDTVRLAQWPVITIVLEIPLTVTTLSLQAIVWFSLMPDTSSGAPCGGSGSVDGPELGVALVDDLGVRVVVRGEVVTGVVVTPEELMIDRTPESWCAAKAAMPPARASTPMTMIVPRIHHMRLPEGGLGGGPAYGPP